MKELDGNFIQTYKNGNHLIVLFQGIGFITVAGTTITGLVSFIAVDCWQFYLDRTARGVRT